MFLIHPENLSRRRQRCAPVVEKLRAMEREMVRQCNLCGSGQNVIIADRDRYGMPNRSALCLHCGLIYLIDRFTPSGYADFYVSGAYRSVSSLYNGVDHNIEQIQADQVAYARKLLHAIEGYVPRRKGMRLLDVGGSAGVVALECARQLGFEATVLDPAAEETAAAKKLGLKVVTGSVEEWETDEKFNLILLCRSVEHVMDLRASLLKIRELLCPNGLFYCDVADFMELCRLTGPPETVTKIDHCYWLTQEAAPAIFRSVGFEIVSMNLIFQQAQIGFLLRQCERSPAESMDASCFQKQIRELQEVERAWIEYGRAAPNSMAWLRRKAYRVKRKLQHLAW